MNNKNKNICIIGGAGHVGAPLGLSFSLKGFNVTLIDQNKKNIKSLNKKKMPFLEEGCEPILKKMVKKKRIFASNNFDFIKNSKFVIICVGTPINKNQKPELKKFAQLFYNLKKYLHKNQIIIIRSSVSLGTCKKVYNIIKNKCKNLSYCPERIAQGKSIKELPKISQIVSAYTNYAKIQSGNLFKKISKKVIFASIKEAELIKLFSNAYRYINFSISNQFYMICEKENLNFFKIRRLMRDNYIRNENLPKAGFAAGPCLPKDTLQLSSQYNHKFKLFKSAYSINDGIPNFIINKISKIKKFKTKKIGVLGLAFKSGNDDIRDSLSIKLLKLLKSKGIKTFQSDEYYKNKNNIDKKNLIKRSDIIIIATPHKQYKNLKIHKSKIVIDIWGTFEKE